MPRLGDSSRLATVAALAMSIAGCGGGGDSTTVATGGGGSTVTPTVTTYAASVVIGDFAPHRIDYRAAVGTSPATVTPDQGVPLLPAAADPLVAEHVDAAYPGMRVACVSGNGQSTNVVGPINLGVFAQSAAVLLDSGWSPVANRGTAWAAVVARAADLSGWENCGVKPEGAPSRSSRLTPRTDGGYSEDIYDGNPGTTINVITQTVSAAQMAAMLSDAGYASLADPLRPLRLYMRLYNDGAGRLLLIQTGVPMAGAASAGFIALYTAL